MRKLPRITLTISILKQGKRYIAYAPALDLSTSGKSEKEAKRRFAEAALLFVEELERAGTTGEVLKELGWKQKEKQWTPPRVVTEAAVGLRFPIAA